MSKPAQKVWKRNRAAELLRQAEEHARAGSADQCIEFMTRATAALHAQIKRENNGKS